MRLAWRSGVVLFDESHVFLERNSSAVVRIYFVEVPLHHLFSNRDVQGLKSVLHQLAELLNVYQVVLVVRILQSLLCLLSSFSKEVGKLHSNMLTY